MNRRTFFGMAATTLGALSLGRILGPDIAFAAPKGKAKGGAKPQATEESLKGVAKASGITDKNFFQEGDKVASVQNFCDASKPKNPACGPNRQPGQFCGNCNFFKPDAKVVYEGDLASNCMLIQPQGDKKYVAGHNYCASYFKHPTAKYELKA